MPKNILPVSIFNLLVAFVIIRYTDVKENVRNITGNGNKIYSLVRSGTDTIPPPEVMDVITAVIYSTNSFNMEALADLYTPNAVVADDEPPYSWNGPTAGIQWVNAIEQVCKDNRLTKLKATIEAINVYQQSADNVYVVVPVSYKGNLPGSSKFYANGAFTFVLRLVNNKWMVKSQVWMPKKGIK
jgi:ketosteroid isomerase-like protein